MLAAPPGEVVLLAYFPDSRGLESALGAALPAARIEAQPVPDVDWVQRFRDGFSPFPTGGFWIVPAWLADARPPDGLRPLRVDPGRAFGTGTHETTRLCLRAIEAESPPPAPDARMLDVGSGTAILAVAAGLLGWSSTVAVDMDEEAIVSARRHAALNAVPVGLVRGNGASALAQGAFRLVVANLTAALLLERRDEILRVACPGAVIVLSGLLVTDIEAVVARYAGAGRIETRSEGEWASVRVGLPR
jgi:ribosomal protein L11 methyltransferase